MKVWDLVAIIGVGLIGGSIGRALRTRKLARKVVGIGRRKASLEIAEECGAVDFATTDWAEGLAEADLVVVCTPVDQIEAHVRQAAQYCRPGTLITDGGSTKQQICAALSRTPPTPAVFVGSHPMAGGEKTGAASAQADLFEGKPAIVTPSANSFDGHVQQVEQFWESLGAIVIRLSPSDHDRTVAATSHLPHLVVAALAAGTPDECLRLTSTGWRDTTRIASGDAELWRQILLQNRDHVVLALDRYVKLLGSIRDAMAANESDNILALLTEGKTKRDAVGS